MKKNILCMFICILFAHTVYAGEYQEKPVMCGSEEEVFPLFAEKNETLLMTANQLTKVRDPDEDNGLSLTPAILPFAVYVNLETGTYTVLEYHKNPYNVYCVISFGTEAKIGEFGK